MKDIRWIIQRNLLAENDITDLLNAVKAVGLDFETVDVIPFSPDIPNHPIDDNHTNIYYGSTTLIWNVFEKLKPSGIFYDPVAFSMENYVRRWGKHNMLSDNPSFYRFQDLVETASYRPDTLLFIRPDADTKSFSGEVIEFGDIKAWYSNLLKDDIFGLGPDTKVMVNTPYKIDKEWRNQIVNGKVVASSRYREFHELSISGTDIPPSMIQFAENMCAIYTPHDVFTMDIALTTDGYSIIECGCSNSVGLYQMNPVDYIRSISEYVSRL